MKKEKNKNDNQEKLEHFDVSELIEKLKIKHKLISPIHLYEDIDPSELKIILQMISKLEQETGVFDLNIKKEMTNRPNERMLNFNNLISSDIL